MEFAENRVVVFDKRTKGRKGNFPIPSLRVLVGTAVKNARNQAWPTWPGS